MNRPLFALVLTLTLLPSAQAGDATKGRQLVDKHCQSCHGSEVYTRPDRRVTSLDGLHKQVRRCELALGLTWFDNEIDDVSAYLDQRYYKFK